MKPNENLTSILVDFSQHPETELIPADLRPVRASVSTNFLAVLGRLHGPTPALVIHNFDPATYNTWYPLFYFSPWDLPQAPVNYGELASAVSTECPEHVRASPHRLLAEAQIRSKLGLGRFSSSSERPVPEEIWLKYSKSKNQWTAYRFDYFTVTSLDQEALTARADQTNIDFLPLAGDDFRAVVETGMFRGRPVVDNLLRLLADPSVIGRLAATAL